MGSVAWEAAACGGAGAVPVATAVATPAFAGAIDSARALIRGAARYDAGVAIAVYRAGQPVWVEGQGYADLHSRAPVDPRTTRFRIYSVAKAMTATAAVRLAEQGKLDPAAPIQRYVPSFPRKSAPITAMELATHRSGIRHYASDVEANSTRHCASVADALEIFENDPLVHPPGATETYSSWGYVLLSGVVAGAAGMPFMEAMQRLVFEPARLTTIGLDDPAIDVPGRATFYAEADSALHPARRVDNTCKWGAGGFVATADDVARFGAAMLDGTLISRRSLDLFLRGSPTYRAQGVGVGGTAFLLIDAAHDLSIALLGNTAGDRAGPALQAALPVVHDLFIASSDVPGQ